MASGWGAVGGGGGGAWGGNQGAWGGARQPDEDAAPQQGTYMPPAPQEAPPLHTTSRGAPTASFGAAKFGASAPAGSFNAGPGGPSAAQIHVKEEQLKKREAELAAKEKQLKEYEKKLMEAGHIKPKNWPFRCYGFLHHDIAGEIPERSRRPVREAYLAWFGLVWCFIWQFFCTCVMLGTDDSKRISSWFLSLIYAICGIPLGFWLWYWRLYKGAKEDSTLGFLGFFLWFGVHTGWCVWAAIAPSFGYAKWAFAGFITAFQAFDYGSFQGIIYLVGGGCWAAEALFSFWIIRDVWYFFRGQGGVKQVQQEAALAAFRSQIQSGSTRV